MNPLTVVDASQGVTRLYRIETGERRYWATWLLRDFIEGYSGDGMVPCILIPLNKSSVFRQAKENTARSGLTAIAMAGRRRCSCWRCMAMKSAYAVNNDFYRQALNLDLRGKREYTDTILSAMGGIKKGYFSELKALLRFSDEALEIADRHGIEQYKLRYVLSLPEQYHAEVVRQIIDLNLTNKQVKDLCENNGVTTDEEVSPERLPAAIRWLAPHSTTNLSAQDIAQAILQQEGNANLARARLQSFQQLLMEAQRYLNED
ncbi:MAG: hypothetical protein U0670_24880 [Anaerolineae bacterium]